MQYSYRKKIFSGRAKLIWIIGDPDKRSSAVPRLAVAVECNLSVCHKSPCFSRPYTKLFVELRPHKFNIARQADSSEVDIPQYHAYRNADSGSKSRPGHEIYLFSESSKLALGSTLLPIRCEPVCFRPQG